MLSTNALQAFTTNTAAPAHRPAHVRTAHVPEVVPAQAKSPLPERQPAVPPPRGSLLNLSV